MTRQPLTPSPTRCPTCEGRGVLPQGFYFPYAFFTATHTNPDTCRTCGGSGLVQSFIDDQRIAVAKVDLT